VGRAFDRHELDAANAMRKIERDRFLRPGRIFKNAHWLDQIYLLHILDHPAISRLYPARPVVVLPNPYFADDSTAQHGIEELAA
jgi:hypothetical protein